MKIKIILLIILIPLQLFAIQNNNVVPKRIIIDPPTYHCLSFRWLIEGDDNENASVSVYYKRTGRQYQDWKEALPLLRIANDLVDRDYNEFLTGNLFAGSILNLTPGAKYDVYFVMSDPDGGYAEKVVEAQTKSYPRPFETKNIINVYPKDYEKEKNKPYYNNLNDALIASAPGTIINIHEGRYKGTYQFEKEGSPYMPIVIRGSNREDVIFDGEDTEGKIFDIQDKSYIHFENLTITNGNIGIKANYCKGLKVQNCKIDNINYGIIAYGATSDWFIYNNYIEGKVESWYPRKQVQEKYSTCTGITVEGKEIVVCFNTIKNFWDCLTINNLSQPDNWKSPRNVSIDFYNNDLSNAGDDALEVDFSYHNVRAWHNRIVNAHVGISAQPIYGGPVYIFRNVVYNVTRTALKLHNWPSGVLVYNNTFVSAGRVFWSDAIWQNTTIKNNLLLGNDNYTLVSGTPDPRSEMDYNGYYNKPDKKPFIKWTRNNYKTSAEYDNLYKFTNDTGLERHGVYVKYDDFVDLTPPQKGHTYDPRQINFKITASSNAVNSGLKIPTITKKVKDGRADLGFWELENKLPIFGKLNF